MCALRMFYLSNAVSSLVANTGIVKAADSLLFRSGYEFRPLITE